MFYLNSWKAFFRQSILEKKQIGKLQENIIEENASLLMNARLLTLNLVSLFSSFRILNNFLSNVSSSASFKNTRRKKILNQHEQWHKHKSNM